MNTLDLYIDDLLQQAWFKDEKEREFLSSDLKNIIVDRILIKSALTLTEEQMQQATDIFKNDINNFLPYLEKNVQNFDTIYEEILTDFSKEYLSNFNITE